MAWLPISGTVPQYINPATNAPYSGAVLKAYLVNSSTNTPFAVDAAATATASSIALNASGNPEVSGNVVIPHMDRNYKLALYPTQAAADADSGAIWTIDNITLPGLTTATAATSGDINIWPLENYGGGYFDGSNDYLTRGSGLTGAADGKKGTLVAYVSFDAAAAAVEYILANTGLALALRRNADGTITLLAENSGGSTILDISTTNAYNTADTVYCIMASWDMNTPGSGQIYINDTADLVTSTFTNDTIDYTVGDWSVGADVSGASKITGNIYSVWLDTTANIDFDTEANRRKFLDDSSRPVYLGNIGQIPTGSKPILFLGNDAEIGLNENRGSGGDFSITGALTAPTVTLEGQYGDKAPYCAEAVATTSGTSVVLSDDVPSWATRIDIMFGGVSTSGSADLLVQIGDSGGYETTGYSSTSANLSGGSNVVTASTAGYIVVIGAASDSVGGYMTLLDFGNNQWVENAVLETAQTIPCAGRKTLSGVLTQIRITTVGGADTFDAGEIKLRFS